MKSNFKHMVKLAVFLSVAVFPSLLGAEVVSNCGLPSSASHKRRLVILVPGLEQHASAWRPLLQRVQSEDGYREDQADWLCIDHDLTLGSWGDIGTVARNVQARIDQQWSKAGGYDDVVLAGHSIGGLIVREVFLRANGADSQKGTQSEWGPKVSRIVLFAALNRGIDEKASVWRRFLAWGLRIAPLPHLIIEDTLRGSDYILNLRVNWIRYFRSSIPKQFPYITQLVGTKDDVVSEADSEDILSFPNSRPVRIPDADHGNLYRIEPGTSTDPEGRYTLIRSAFLDNAKFTKEPGPENTVKRVLFVLHGIRASTNDHWVQDLEQYVREHYPDTVVIHPEYGYLTALKFALPSGRRKNIRWFQDFYGEALANYPNAEFDFIGHSNGTYIFGQSLLHIRAMRWNNVALAGSVLPEDYDWTKVSDEVQKVRNDRADLDWPVGLLCSALHGIGMWDIGTGGYKGFRGASVIEEAYHHGGHGQALLQPNLGKLAEFALLGQVDTVGVHLIEKPTGWFHLLSLLAPWILGVAVIFALWRFWILWKKRAFKTLVIIAIVMFLVYVLLDVV